MGNLQINGNVNIRDLLTLRSGTDAYTTPSIAFGNDVRIGYGNKNFGIYSSNNIYLRPNSGTLGYSDGVELSTTALIPTKNNTITLGNSTHKWSNVYATTFIGALSGNASSATTANTAAQFTSARTISLTGDVTGSASSTGGNGWSITTTVADDSHNHIISNIDNLQTELNGRSFLTARYSVSAGDENTHYYKLFTFKPTGTAYLDEYYSFDVVARANKYATVHIYVVTTNDNKYISNAYITYESHNTELGGKISAYIIRDTATTTDTLEIWGTITSWNTWRIYPKTHYHASAMSFTWVGTEATALPTSVHKTITVDNRPYLGNASSASQFNSAKSITLSGDVTGTASSTGASGWSITTAIGANNHAHDASASWSNRELTVSVGGGGSAAKASIPATLTGFTSITSATLIASTTMRIPVKASTYTSSTAGEIWIVA